MLIISAIVHLIVNWFHPPWHVFFLTTDIRFMFFSDDSNNGGIVGLIFGLLMLFVAPLVATLLRLAISRKREFLADASGALLTRYPEGLAEKNLWS